MTMDGVLRLYFGESNPPTPPLHRRRRGPRARVAWTARSSRYPTRRRLRSRSRWPESAAIDSLGAEPPLGRAGRPDEVAAAVAYPVLDEAASSPGSRSDRRRAVRF
jgi:NAD(P)-dependent dehydrogenase (short-subunit alcohol dehydrogenase family)